MEDISRELEREIAGIKPAPFKRRKENRILIINNLGESRSGDFLKVFVALFLVISIVGGLGTIVFYRLYSNANTQNIKLKRSQDVLEKKVDRLTDEKELLMARLVVTGNTAELKTLASAGKIGLNPRKKEKRPGMKHKKALAENAAPDLQNVEKEHEEYDVKKYESGPGPGHGRGGQETVGSTEHSPNALTNVSIGAFSISQGSSDQDVIVRFNIKNTTQNAKEVSGRIFCVLKPVGATTDKWVVIPRGQMTKAGIPGPYKQGHYFSISRFKPVRFTIHTLTPLQDFVKAWVFIFDETEKLLSKTTFDIGKNKQD